LGQELVDDGVKLGYLALQAIDLLLEPFASATLVLQRFA
jgi:hypothetical protein